VKNKMQKQLTDSEKLDSINARLKRVEINSFIHVAIVVVTFLGIISLSDLISKVKAKI
jgi:Cu/Ag efflux pump CusA